LHEHRRVGVARIEVAVEALDPGVASVAIEGRETGGVESVEAGGADGESEEVGVPRQT